MKKFLLLICIASLSLCLIACSCSNEQDDHSGHDHSSGTTASTNQNQPNDNGGNEPPLAEKHKNHYWTGLEISENNSATSSSVIKGYCIECGDSLSREVVTTVTYEEWKASLSQAGLTAFTAYSNGLYTDYDENGSRSWKISDNTITEEYFIGIEGKNSQAYAERFAGFTLSYNSFTYNRETRSYVSYVDENTWVELGFADGKLFLHATNHKEGDTVNRTETLFFNYDSAKSEVPQYFFDTYEEIVKADKLSQSSIGKTAAEGLSAFLSVLSFDGAYEISYLPNDQLSVYIYLAEPQTDPIFNSQYDSVSIVAIDGKITSVTIGNNTVELSY